METLLYLAKVNLYLVLFYLTYRLLLSNHTFFNWNRIYLIGSLLIAFVLPLITFPETVVTSQPAFYAASSLPVYISASEPVSWVSKWIPLLITLLAAGSLYLFFGFIKSVKDVIAMIKQADVMNMDNFKLVLLPHNNIGSFSFFKWLVMNRIDYEQNFEPILRHESVHIHQKHSLDILLIELLKIAFWFNPVLWLYKRSIQEVHEFLADEHAPDRDGYARFLVAYAFNAPAAALTNHFFNGPLLKSRITMIYKNRNSEWLRSKYLIILPLICFVVIMTAARKQVSATIEERIPASIVEVALKRGEIPDFKAINSQTTKPKAAKTKSIMSEASGKTNTNFATAKSYTSQIADSLPAASSQKATFVNYNFGTRSLQAGTQLDSFPKIGKTLTIKSNNGPGSKALIIVDGVKQEQRGSMGYVHIAPEQIESINILKDESAINAYGAEGADGVILIKTKK